MTVVIFCGPSLASADVPRGLQVDVRPPAVRGDVLRAALSRPAAIALIDGYFHQVPAVWHKEILWAMSEGIHVFGAASMGALRAAELAAFGMEGVGRVFEWYRAGVLCDDDEVAVTHASADHGYRTLSEALVNIRVTLRAATAATIVSQETRVELEHLAKGLFYPDRTYSGLLASADRTQVPRSEIVALRDWLPSGRIDQKRADAALLLQCLAEHERAGWTPKRVEYVFAHTNAWEVLRNSCGSNVTSNGAQTTIPLGSDHMKDVTSRLTPS